MQILNSQTRNVERNMRLVRPLVIPCLKHNTQIKAVNISGCKNSIADANSQVFQWDRFISLAAYPTQLTLELWEILNVALKDSYQFLL